MDILTRKEMESINRIELLGTVGHVHTAVVGDKQYARISLATCTAHRDECGEAFIEQTWFQVQLIESLGAKLPAKGDNIHVWGRITFKEYIGENGVSVRTPDVLARKWEFVND